MECGEVSELELRLHPAQLPGDMETGAGPPGSPEGSPVDSLVDSPVDPHVDLPVDSPEDSPVDLPVDSPEDSPMDSPVDPPVDLPLDSPEDSPVDLPVDSPEDSPVDPPETENSPVDSPVGSALDGAAPAASRPRAGARARGARRPHRTHMCVACRTHGVLVPRKGHAFCPNKHCVCPKCDVQRGGPDPDLGGPGSARPSQVSDRAAKLTGEDRRRRADRQASALDRLCADKPSSAREAPARLEDEPAPRAQCRLCRHHGQAANSNHRPCPFQQCECEACLQVKLERELQQQGGKHADRRSGTGQAKCGLCLQHGKMVLRLGHTACPHEHCRCMGCRSVRRLRAPHLRWRRMVRASAVYNYWGRPAARAWGGRRGGEEDEDEYDEEVNEALQVQERAAKQCGEDRRREADHHASEVDRLCSDKHAAAVDEEPVRSAEQELTDADEEPERSAEQELTDADEEPDGSAEQELTDADEEPERPAEQELTEADEEPAMRSAGEAPRIGAHRCVQCLLHGQIANKNHKLCPYRACVCEECCRVRQLRREQQRLDRRRPGPRSRLVKSCRLCRNHNVVATVKHQPCPHEQCQCAACSKVRARRAVEALQAYRRSHQLSAADGEPEDASAEQAEETDGLRRRPPVVLCAYKASRTGWKVRTSSARESGREGREAKAKKTKKKKKAKKKERSTHPYVLTLPCCTRCMLHGEHRERKQGKKHDCKYDSCERCASIFHHKVTDIAVLVVDVVVAPAVTRVAVSPKKAKDFTGPANFSARARRPAAAEDKITIPGLGRSLLCRLDELHPRTEAMPPPVLELGQDEAGEGATSAFVEALRQWAAKKLQEAQGAQGKQGGGGRTGLLGAARQKGQPRTGLQDAGQAASQPRTGLQDAEQGSQPRTGLQDAGQAGSQPRTGLQDAEQGSQPRTGLQDAEQGSQGNNDDTDQKPSACARCGAMVNHNDAVRGLHECDDLVESAPLSDSFVAQLTICLECDTVVECDKLCHCYQLGGQHGDPVGDVQVDSQGYSLGDQHGDQDGNEDVIQDGDQDGDQDGEQHGEQQEGESAAVEPPPNCARETVRDQESDSSSEMDCSSENVTPVGASGPSTTSDNQGRLRCRPIEELQMEVEDAPPNLSSPPDAPSSDGMPHLSPQGKIYRRIDAPPILSPQRIAHQTHSPPPLSPQDEPPTSEATLRSPRQESEDDEEAAELLATPILQTNSPQPAAVHPHSTPLLDTEQSSLVPQSHVHRASAAAAPRQPCLPCLMCPESEAVLMTSHDLDAHMFEAHGGTAGDVQCGACQVHFRDEDTLLAHARRCHDGLLFDVALLGASAAQEEAVCRLCWRQFADKAAVRTHQEAQHMGLVPLDRLEHLASLLLNLRLTHVSGQDPGQDERAEDDAEVEIVGEVSSPHTYGGARRCDCASCLGVIRRRPTQQLINSRIETHTR